MSEKRLLHALSQVDDGFITEAAPGQVPNPKKRSAARGPWLKWIAIAACFCILIGTFLIVPLGSAHHQYDPTVSPDLPSHEVPPQPIAFDDFAAAVCFLQNPDYSGYREDRKIAYGHMVEDFRSDGYILRASHETATLYEGHGRIFLYPDVKYEDVGVSYWFVSAGETYQVLLYNTREGAEYTIDLETQDFTDYWIIRMGLSQDIQFQWTTVDHPILSNMILGKRNEHISLTGMIDATHYIAVTAVSDTTAATIKEFTEGLIIEQYPIG